MKNTVQYMFRIDQYVKLNILFYDNGTNPRALFG